MLPIIFLPEHYATIVLSFMPTPGQTITFGL